MTAEQTRKAALAKSLEAQAIAKRENAKHMLTKAETTALWHAVNWMELCVRQPVTDDTPQEAIDAERERLRLAKSCLRKVNALRKQGL